MGKSALQRFAQLAVHLDEQQRMAAQIEEVLLDARLRSSPNIPCQTAAIAFSISVCGGTIVLQLGANRRLAWSAGTRSDGETNVVKRADRFIE